MVIPGMVFSPTPNYVQPPVAGYGIRLPGATSGAVSIKPAAVAGSVEFTLPPSTVIGGALTDVTGNGVLTMVVPSVGSGGGGGTDTFARTMAFLGAFS